MCAGRRSFANGAKHMTIPSLPWPLADIQGLLLRGYRQTFVRYFALSVADPKQARDFIANTVNGAEGIPQITSAQPWRKKPQYCLNIGFTFRGLKNLGLAPEYLDALTNNIDNGVFASGSASRASTVGDVCGSDPKNWVIDDQDFDVLLILFALTMDELESMSTTLDELLAAGFKPTGERTRFDSQALEDGKVYFGFKDGIAEPTIQDSPFPREPDGPQDEVDPGAFIFGLATTPFFSSIVPPEPDDLGKYGCFGAFRILRQDVEGFEAQIKELAPAFGAKFGITDPQVQEAAIRAKMCGRWPNGAPLVKYPINGNEMPPNLPPEQLNNFGYGDDTGDGCPMGAHIRRTNPRDTKTRLFNGSPVSHHRVLRRAMAYQDPYDSNNRDTGERGLLGLFMGTSFLEQFEFVMQDWVNNQTGFGTEQAPADPLMGTNTTTDNNGKLTCAPFYETIPTKDNPHPTRKNPAYELTPMNSFVHTKGSAYCYFPGIPGIAYLGSLTG
jgi:deferrochelatase/peroxidase EfeB